MRDVGTDVVKHLILGLGHRQSLVELLEESGLGVHAAHEVIHVLEPFGLRLDDDVHTLALDVELPIGDQGGHLDESVVGQVEPGHLAIDPHQHVFHVTTD